ncbi:hypothetical protein EW894_02240 [Salmonella enterica subsp. enterica serovar Typhimurium]|nr:hypothetical protein [Salmonella enterica subsp. enterica serovar Typhimurium]
MNKYLKAGLSSAENGLLVLESLTENINAVLHPTIPSSVGLDELLALKETLHRDKQVSRQQLTMLSYSLPDAMEGKPLALWTELPSTTGFNEACRVVDKAIAIIGEQLRNASATQVKDLLEQELTRLEENASYVDDFTALTQSHVNRFAEIQQTVGRLIDHPDVKEDIEIAIEKYESKLLQVWSPIIDLAGVTEALTALYAADTQILKGMLALTPDQNNIDDTLIPTKSNTTIDVIKPYFDDAGYLIPNNPATAEKEWDATKLHFALGTAVYASQVIRDAIHDYPETAQLVKQLIGQVENVRTDDRLDGVSYLATITRCQCQRVIYQRMLVEWVRAVLSYAEVVTEVIMSVSETAAAVRSEELWDKTQEEIEAADGYTRIELVQEGFFGPILKLFDKKGPNPLLDSKASKSWKYLENIQQQIAQTYANKSWVERNIHDKPVVSKRVARALSFDDGKVRMPTIVLKEAISAMRSVQKLIEAPAQARHTKLKQLEEKALRRIKAGENQYQVAKDTLAEAKKIKPLSTIPESSYPNWLGYKYSTFFNMLMLQEPVTDELPKLNVDDVVETGKFLTNDAAKALKEFTTADVFCGTGCDTELWNYDAFGDDDELYDQFYLHSKFNETTATDVYYSYLEAFVNVCSATVEWLARQTSLKALKMEGYGIYTAESAWETLRRTMEYTVNILKRLVDWLVKSWRNGSAKAAIQQAEANNSQLTRAKDALLTEGTKKRLASLHTVGIQTIAKYAEAGTIWSGAFKGVTDNLGNVSALISSEVKELSNGRELDQDKLAKIREGLALAFEKGNFNKVLLGHNGITIDNLASEIHDYREELKDQFKESTNESIDVDKLIRYNDGCRKFLQGPITDARNKVSGHELDNLLTMLNSMIRQQASSPENKGLGALKNEIVNARDLAKAAVDVLGIAQWLEVRAKRYINALSTVVDKANSEAAAVSGSLKQESFDLNEVVLSSTSYDVCSVAATSLAANRFRNSRDELRRHYNQALEAALQVYNRAIYNHAVIGQHLLGVMPRFTGVFSNYPWTLGLDLQVSNPSALNAFCEKLSRSIELYGAGTADSITQAVALLDSTELCYAVDPNHEGESGNSSALATHMFEYRRLAKEALEHHSDFTTEEQRRGWYATFMDSSPSWEPDNTLPVVTEDVDPSLVWAFASLFCAALNAYIALRYGTDLKVYGWFSEQQNNTNVR